MRKPLKVVLLILGVLLAAFALLILARFGATAPPTHIMEPATPASAGGSGAAAGAPDVTLPDLVYFGSAWQLLNKKVGMPPIVLGGGYADARVERTGDGLFFAGIVDRRNRAGEITDVILAFGGAQGVADYLQGRAFARGDIGEEPRWAAILFERVWNDPRYRGARIHVTGHSLGAGYAQFVRTEAVARHGSAAVAARVRIVAFGVPNWGRQSARYYRLPPDVLDPLFTGYTALNDPVLTNGGTDRVGVSHFLPPFTRLAGPASIANVVAAHWPTTYMAALGLPDWLTPEQKASCIERVSGMFITGRSFDPAYAIPGGFKMITVGSPAALQRKH